MPHWQCPWSTGSPFPSCPACGDLESGKAQVARYTSTNGVRAAVRHFSVKFLCWHSSSSPILASHSRHWSTPSFLVETKICTAVLSSKFAYIICKSKIPYRATKFKTTKFNSGSLFQLSSKFPPMKITCYTSSEHSLTRQLNPMPKLPWGQLCIGLKAIIRHPTHLFVVVNVIKHLGLTLTYTSLWWYWSVIGC